LTIKGTASINRSDSAAAAGKGLYLLTVLLIIAIAAAGCAGQQEKNKGVDGPAKNGLPSITAKSPGVPEINGLHPGDIPICYSSDLKALYVTNYSRPGQEIKAVLGDYTLPVDLYRLDGDQRTKLAAGIPFITLARWSPGGKYLGLAGGQQLYILNPGSGRLDSVNKAANLPSAVFFGWSPDGRTVYAEHDAVPNGAVYNVETSEGLPAYRINEPKPFFKAKLSDNLFLGTAMSDGRTAGTVIMDGEGQTQKSVAPGRFRDVAGNSILQAGNGGFGLAFYADVYQPEGIILSDKYIYQCCFLPQGGVIYSTPGESSAELSYDLTVVTRKEQKTVKVSGPHFQVWPDGRFADVCGYRAERLSLPDLTVVLQQDRPPYGGEEEGIVAAARGAASSYIYYYFHSGSLDGRALRQELSRYYMDTREPVEQVALTDVCEEIKSRPSHLRYGAHNLTGQIESLAVHGEDRASLTARLTSSDMFLHSDAADDPWLRFNSTAGGWAFDVVYEMVKRDGNWYVTGLSTFPAAQERERLAELVKIFIAAAKSGGPAPFRDEQSKQFYEQIKEKEIGAGQIQFWNMSEPHRSPDTGQARYALVYLYTGGERYRLVFSREETMDWEIESLRDSSRPGIL